MAHVLVATARQVTFGWCPRLSCSGSGLLEPWPLAESGMRYQNHEIKNDIAGFENCHDFVFTMLLRVRGLLGFQF